MIGFNTMNNIPVIEIKNLKKTYLVENKKPTLIETYFNKQNKTKHIALQEINLTIYKGEKIGIIGLNGAGKTTLLKLIVGITTPQKGTIRVYGRIVSLIDLMAGFHPEMSGYENIKLNGLLIGMSAKEIQKKMNQIIKFANIGKFIYAPLHTYSSGMQLRLGFSIAIHSNPDILVLDENISVGDEKFKIKANKKIQSLFKKNKTVIMVSHWLNFLNENCNRIIWLEKGKVKKDGSTKLLKEYYDLYIVKSKKK